MATGEEIQTEVKTALPAQYFREIGRLLNLLDARPHATHSPRGLAQRGVLGDFTSVTCFKALISGLEDLLGAEATAVVCLRAGRLRGKNLVEDWGVGHLHLPPEKLGHLLDAALGHDGTRLCAVHSIQQRAEGILVAVTDTICSVNEPPGSLRRCQFTLGALWGALEALTGDRFRAEQIQSVLAGDTYDQFMFTPLS